MDVRVSRASKSSSNLPSVSLVPMPRRPSVLASEGTPVPTPRSFSSSSSSSLATPNTSASTSGSSGLPTLRSLRNLLPFTKSPSTPQQQQQKSNEAPSMPSRNLFDSVRRVRRPTVDRKSASPKPESPVTPDAEPVEEEVEVLAIIPRTPLTRPKSMDEAPHSDDELMPPTSASSHVGHDLSTIIEADVSTVSRLHFSPFLSPRTSGTHSSLAPSPILSLSDFRSRPSPHRPMPPPLSPSYSEPAEPSFDLSSLDPDLAAALAPPVDADAAITRAVDALGPPLLTPAPSDAPDVPHIRLAPSPSITPSPFSRVTPHASPRMSSPKRATPHPSPFASSPRRPRTSSGPDSESPVKGALPNFLRTISPRASPSASRVSSQPPSPSLGQDVRPAYRSSLDVRPRAGRSSPLDDVAGRRSLALARSGSWYDSSASPQKPYSGAEDEHRALGRVGALVTPLRRPAALPPLGPHRTPVFSRLRSSSATSAADLERLHLAHAYVPDSARTAYYRRSANLDDTPRASSALALRARAHVDDLHASPSFPRSATSLSGAARPLRPGLARAGTSDESTPPSTRQTRPPLSLTTSLGSGVRRDLRTPTRSSSGAAVDELGVRWFPSTFQTRSRRSASLSILGNNDDGTPLGAAGQRRPPLGEALGPRTQRVFAAAGLLDSSLLPSRWTAARSASELGYHTSGGTAARPGSVATSAPSGRAASRAAWSDVPGFSSRPRDGRTPDRLLEIGAGARRESMGSPARTGSEVTTPRSASVSGSGTTLTSLSASHFSAVVTAKEREFVRELDEMRERHAREVEALLEALGASQKLVKGLERENDELRVRVRDLRETVEEERWDREREWKWRKEEERFERREEEFGYRRREQEGLGYPRREQYARDRDLPPRGPSMREYDDDYTPPRASVRAHERGYDRAMDYPRPLSYGGLAPHEDDDARDHPRRISTHSSDFETEDTMRLHAALARARSSHAPPHRHSPGPSRALLPAHKRTSSPSARPSPLAHPRPLSYPHVPRAESSERDPRPASAASSVFPLLPSNMSLLLGEHRPSSYHAFDASGYPTGPPSPSPAGRGHSGPRRTARYDTTGEETIGNRTNGLNAGNISPTTAAELSVRSGSPASLNLAPEHEQYLDEMDGLSMSLVDGLSVDEEGLA